MDEATLRLAAEMYPRYQAALRDLNAADFGDLILYPTRTMLDSEPYRRMWAGRFDEILSDEYQDVNYAQYMFLQLLARDHNNLFCVGDDDQAIFSWRGSDVEYIRRFKRDYPSAKLIKLEDNFRCTGNILSAANAVMALGRDRIGKTLRPTRGAGEKIELIDFFNAQDEAEGIVTEMRKRIAEGVRLSDIAIIYRYNAASRAFEELLLRGRIPHIIVGDVGFWARAEVKDGLALLRLATMTDSRQSDEAFRRVVNIPSRGIGEKALAKIEATAHSNGSCLLEAARTTDLPGKARAGLASFLDAIAAGSRKSGSLADQISALLERSGYRKMLRDSKAERADEQLQNLAELIGVAQDFHSAEELFEHAALATTESREDPTGKIQLMSMHRAKGLEFGHVFLPSWEAGIVPSQSAEDFEEERRLAYVALTRAKDRLTITTASMRHGRSGSPSPFIAEMPPSALHRGWLRTPARPQQAPPPSRPPVDPGELLRRFR